MAKATTTMDFEDAIEATHELREEVETIRDELDVSVETMSDLRANLLSARKLAEKLIEQLDAALAATR